MVLPQGFCCLGVEFDELRLLAVWRATLFVPVCLLRCEGFASGPVSAFSL
jgi:hypothetical protein